MHSSQFILISWTVALTTPISAAPLSVAAGGPQCCAIHTDAPEYCAGTANNSTLQDQYLCGDWRLGPNVLPKTLPPLAPVLQLYNRFGGLCPGAYLEKWWDSTLGSNGGWIYPECEGFSLDLSGDEMSTCENKQVQGRRIDGNVTLPAGTLIDRFGSEKNGIYFGPAGAPYMLRALPPSNLDTPQDNPQ